MLFYTVCKEAWIFTQAQQRNQLIVSGGWMIVTCCTIFGGKNDSNLLLYPTSDRFLKISLGKMPCCLPVAGLLRIQEHCSHSQSHTTIGFFKLVEALLQIDSSFFSRNIKVRDLPLLAVIVSPHYLPRCLRSTVTCGKTPTISTWSEPLKICCHCYCCTIKTNSRTIRLQVWQPASAGQGADMSELQAHHCMTPCRTVALVQCACRTGK